MAKPGNNQIFEKPGSHALERIQEKLQRARSHCLPASQRRELALIASKEAAALGFKALAQEAKIIAESV